MEIVIAILIATNICLTIYLLASVLSMPIKSGHRVESPVNNSDQAPTVGSLQKRIPVVNDDIAGYIREEKERQKNEATLVADRARSSLPIKRRIATHL